MMQKLLSTLSQELSRTNKNVDLVSPSSLQMLKLAISSRASTDNQENEIPLEPDEQPPEPVREINISRLVVETGEDDPDDDDDAAAKGTTSPSKKSKKECNLPKGFPLNYTILFPQGDPVDFVSRHGHVCIAGKIKHSDSNNIHLSTPCKISWSQIQEIRIQFLDDNLRIYKHPLESETDLFIRLDVKFQMARVSRSLVL